MQQFLYKIFQKKIIHNYFQLKLYIIIKMLTKKIKQLTSKLNNLNNLSFYRTYYVEGAVVTFIGLQALTIYRRKKTLEYYKEHVEEKKGLGSIRPYVNIETNSDYKVLLGAINPVLALTWPVTIPVMCFTQYLCFLLEE